MLWSRQRRSPCSKQQNRLLFLPKIKLNSVPKWTLWATSSRMQKPKRKSMLLLKLKSKLSSEQRSSAVQKAWMSNNLTTKSFPSMPLTMQLEHLRRNMLWFAPKSRLCSVLLPSKPLPRPPSKLSSNPKWTSLTLPSLLLRHLNSKRLSSKSKSKPL